MKPGQNSAFNICDQSSHSKMFLVVSVQMAKHNHGTWIDGNSGHSHTLHR